MEIIVDDREKAIIPFLNELTAKYNIIYKVQRNQTGDYAIVYKENILLLIERKTWTDLAASMRDGRKENVKKLLNLREQTGCKIAYLIEGDATPSFTKKYGRLPIKNLRAHLDHLMFRDDIHILYSKNEEYTAERLFELAQNYLSTKELTKKLDNKALIKHAEDKHAEITDEIVGGALPNAQDAEYITAETISETQTITEHTTPTTTSTTEHTSTTDTKPTSTTETPSENKAQELLKVKQNIELAIDQQILLCLPCVGSTTAPLLSENNVSLYSIYHNLHDCAYIANIKYTSGAVIGLSKAKKITDLVSKINEVRYTKTRTKILSSIPLISKKSAETILSQIKLTDILDETINAEDLANIKKTEKTKLGNAAASNIIKYLIPTIAFQQL